MSVAHVLTFPDSRLMQGSKLLGVEDQATMRKVQELALTLRETMQEARGWGLAAPQIGVHVALFVVHVPQERKNAMVFVNPQWAPIEGERKTLKAEGCLSFPDLQADVERYDRILVRRFDEFGRFDEQEFEGWTARAIQHEADHLVGKLITDHVTATRRRMIVRGMERWAREPHRPSKVPA